MRLVDAVVVLGVIAGLPAGARAQERANPPEPVSSTGKYVPGYAPAPTHGELMAAADASADSTIGPRFPPGRLEEVVWLLRRIQREHQATRVLDFTHGSSLEVEFILPDSLMRGMDTTRARKTRRTGIRTFDSLTATLGGEEELEFLLLRIARVWLNEPYNVPGVSALYVRTVGGIRPWLLEDWHVGYAAGTSVATTDSVWTVQMEAGWGDCLAGCINRHRWAFRYRPNDGALSMVTDSGPPIPHPFRSGR